MINKLKQKIRKLLVLLCFMSYVIFLVTWECLAFIQTGDDLSDPLIEISLVSPKSKLFVGESVQLSVIGNFSDGTQKKLIGIPNTVFLLFLSDVISVDDNGVLIALKRGTDSFTAMSGDHISNEIQIEVIIPNDTDNDGMTDAFEILHGLNPNDPADGERKGPSLFLTTLKFPSKTYSP